jgi:hypothetical protein
MIHLLSYLSMERRQGSNIEYDDHYPRTICIILECKHLFLVGILRYTLPPIPGVRGDLCSADHGELFKASIQLLITSQIDFWVMVAGVGARPFVPCTLYSQAEHPFSAIVVDVEYRLVPGTRTFCN